MWFFGTKSCVRDYRVICYEGDCATVEEIVAVCQASVLLAWN
jgi:hypothetical protein